MESPFPTHPSKCRGASRPWTSPQRARPSTARSCEGTNRVLLRHSSRLASLVVTIFRLAQTASDQLLCVLRRRVQLLRNFRNAVALEVTQAQRDLTARGDAGERFPRRQLIGERLADAL